MAKNKTKGSVTITRKIEIFVFVQEDNEEKKKEKKNEYYAKLRNNAFDAAKIANCEISHYFFINVVTSYLQEQDEEKIKFIGRRGVPCSPQNAGYTAAAEQFLSEVGSNVISCIAQKVYKDFQTDLKSLRAWDASLRNYHAGMPFPFSAKSLKDLRFEQYTYKDSKGGVEKEREGCFFSLFEIPFQMKFGRDRSNNEAVVRKVISGEYKMCQSSIQWGVKSGKWFLLLCVEIPKEPYTPIAGKELYAFLGLNTPIIYMLDVKAKNAYDSELKKYFIGTRDGYEHNMTSIKFGRRRRRLQAALRDTKGGHGRSHKLRALNTLGDKEHKLRELKAHEYSKRLIEAAVKNNCEKILLAPIDVRIQKAKDDNAKGRDFVLHNWGYYGLLTKLKYKAAKYGIEIDECKELSAAAKAIAEDDIKYIERQEALQKAEDAKLRGERMEIIVS